MDAVIITKITQVAEIIALFVLYVYAKRKRPSQMQKYLCQVIFGSVLMLFGYLLEMEATTVEGAYYGNIISYIGSPLMMVSVFMLVCTFYGRNIPTWLYIVSMTFAPCITAAVATNPLHHLYYTVVSYDGSLMYSPLVLEHGPLYLMNLVSVAGYNVAIIVMIIIGFVKTKSVIKRRLSVYTLLMVLCAEFGYVLYFLGAANGYDCTMFGITAGTVFLAILFFRCRIFDVVDAAKDLALDNSSEGLVVYDDTGKMVYKNAVANSVMSESIPEEYINGVADGKNIYKAEDRVYIVNVNSVKHKKYYLGKSVEINDISESYNYGERLKAAVDEATGKLEGIQRTIFASFASLVEARSLETGDHIARVSVYVKDIADALKERGQYVDILTDEYISTLVHSAPLHDLGKISIPDSILLKPGPLTEEEFSKMKKHSEMGAKIIKSTMDGLESENYVKMASDIALYHHERWDGTGYPKGLSGENIPLSARILAVADCYDAMVSERCYKEAFSDEKATGIIIDEAGTHFEPAIVDAFLACKHGAKG